MLNRSEIFTAAWAAYRAMDVAAVEACAKLGKTPDLRFSRKRFGRCLKAEYQKLRYAKFDAEQAARLAAVPVRERELRSELIGLEMADRMDWDRYRAVRSELNHIAA